MTPQLRNALTKKQAEIIEYVEKHDPRQLILEGAIRSAKTICNIHLFLAHIYKYKGQKKKFIISGTSIASIKRNVLDEIERLFNIATNLNQKNECEIFGNTICCFGTDKSDSYKRIKGFTAFGWLGNEVTDHHENSIRQCFARCSGKGARFFWDTNPDDPEHEIKKNYIDKSDYKLTDGRIGIKSFHFQLDDNDKLDPEYVEFLKTTTPAGMWYDRDILGLWAKAEGIIYIDFDRDKHTITWDELPRDDNGKLLLKDMFAGQDWGYEHPGVLGLYGIDNMGTCYRILEVVERLKGPDWWRDKVKGLYKDYGSFTVYCPHDRPDLKDNYTNNGIITRSADNSPGSVFSGITWIAGEYKKDNAFKVVKDTNENFLKEIRGYRWADKKTKEEPIKEVDDSMDSDRYARYSHLGRSRQAQAVQSLYR
jgi:hypothetical protein